MKLALHPLTNIYYLKTENNSEFRLKLVTMLDEMKIAIHKINYSNNYCEDFKILATKNLRNLQLKV